MKLKIWIVLSVLFISSSLLAATLTVSDPFCACDPKKRDSLEEPQKFNFGQFSGQCVDSCHFRRARILPENRIANILNFGEFYSASLRNLNFSKIEMGFEEFLPGINHIFLKFDLEPEKPAVKLKDQVRNSSRSIETRSIETRSLVLSSEAVPPKGHRYQIFESYFQNYLIATRITTVEEMRRWVKELKHPVKLIPLKIAPQRIKEIFFNAVQDSNDNSLRDVYRLFTNNCSTRALRFLDANGPAKTESGLFGWRMFEEALPLAGPIGTIRALKIRKLIGD